MPKITIYTTDNCPYCIRAKQLLNARGLAFEEINLEGRPEEIASLKARTGWRTVPQIFYDDVLIGGYTELAAKLNLE